MATKKSQYFIYWDSCVFLSWLNEYDVRAPIIQGMWEEVTEKRKGKIITSALSIAEVAHIESEKTKRKRLKRIDEKIAEMWQDPNILVVEAPRYIMEIARELMRTNLQYGGGLRPNDAIHLATVKFMENNGMLIQEINTYDEWDKYEPLLNVTICEPHYDPQYQQTAFFLGGDDEEEVEDVEE